MAAVLTVLYGSESGNAEDVATTMWRQALQRGFTSAHLKYMNDFSLWNNAGQAQTVVFICSTTGQGDIPDNMKLFWKSLLRRSLPANFLAAWNVAVLGLGDSSYQKFNFAARKLQRRLVQLGATEVVEIGLADDQHQRGYDEVVDTWIAKFWAQMITDHPELEIGNVASASYEFTYRIVWSDCTEPAVRKKDTTTSCSRPPDCCPVVAEVVENKRITTEGHFQDVRLISFSLTPDIPYNPGDVLVVQPKNLEESQQLFLDTVSIDRLDRQFRLEPRFSGISVPDFYKNQPLTFRQLIGEVFDLQAVPRRSFFQIFSTFAVDSLQQERLAEFASAEGQEDLHDYCTRPRRTVVEVLRDFQDTTNRLPLEALFDLIGTIKPRSFSIASCIDTQQHLELLVAVVRYKTIMSTPRLGLCSTWLSRLKPMDKVNAWIKTGSFRFPATETPVILVGPGTGVAPLRSFLFFRCHRGVSSSWLFFGCRNRTKDFLCEQDFLKMAQVGTLVLCTAFSRDQEKKIYVQDKLKEQKSLIYDLIRSRNAMIFISGNAKNMPQQVKEMIKDILKDEGGLNENEAQKYMREMHVSMRLQLEVWS